ncbi:WD repeat-containing protein 73-like [Asterias amurensis]|uniref:WD repeat-containing protein 73-like n=1 Tax=Asterias amurensis TaxID=7602 RepID=UPI003AB387A7
MADDEELLDDWFITSLKSYRHLHMFDLPKPTCVIEWIDNNCICVAGCEPNANNEILELSIPAKLMQQEGTTAAGLTKDRDFKMKSGGFSGQPVHCMKYLQGSSRRLIVTGSHLSTDLNVWQLGTETTDVVKKLSSLPGSGVERSGVKVIDQRPGCQGQVAFGSTLSDVQIVDVETSKVVRTKLGSASYNVEIQFLDDDNLVMCNTTSGHINIHDMRATSSQSETPSQYANEAASSEIRGNIDQSNEGLDTLSPERTNENVSNKEEISWTFDLSCSSDIPNEGDTKKRKMDSTTATIARLSTNNEVIVNDLRNLAKPLHTVRLDDSKKLHPSTESLAVKWSPTTKHMISVSGLNECVDIHDITPWQQSSTSPPISKPIFRHEGHMFAESANQQTRILCHTWHPWKPQVMMSSGNDGSLHAWDWSTVS